ncbi:glycine--tRNA ligase subunit beta [Metabacillus idriensis]|uniref:Glycine--tRNA ligase beta subunit n=1 Tax=Metabacillus idriensis TaxID=324768 RepID=A0A6I2ME17_9BACI|nr:glycine--tRNA ligase subunit beta [Metabacillus idriensis]MCM3596267.1 glycine--tRNA ligase subunit beta [Metabacillus idriensis]MRX55969.1 glycine--tRNA ligase subunit beta [Metabacillus idriensis]OHR73921.1 glycine--tRNA ligase subunit beta [Bacillus sp. HMSC76G11]
MSKHDLLLELGLEELPARFVTDAMNQLSLKTTNWLKEKNISFGEVNVFSTPRRLAVQIEGVAAKQEDIEEEAKGPAKKIALDGDGNWSKAAVGFSRGQGASVDDIFFKEIGGIEYAHVQKFIKGKETKELLTDLREIITGLTFPKNMRWGSQELRFARPIKWMIALYGQEVIPFSITGVQTGKETRGHRFLGSDQVINHSSEYEKSLLSQFVIASPVKRKEAILTQLHHIEEENKWNIPIDKDLLEEVTNLVEYPTALFGKFEEEYLSLPEEVLVTTMKEHQRYFPVKNAEGELLPYFVTVRNGDHNHIENVARGNEKVLRARLSDAAFFYNEDQKLVISDNVKKLDKIVFHEELGSTGDKVRRMTSLSQILAERFSVSSEEKTHVLRAAEICKFDLVTHMVYEFPELQGIIGEKYARAFGEAEEVAAAVNEHYMPRHAEDSAPASTAGAIVALADKLDTIAGFFSIGVIPTGSQDPYALRRQASGIVQILLAKKWTISLDELFDLALAPFNEIDQNKVKNEMLAFFKMRVKHVLDEKKIRYDIIDAVLGSGQMELTAIMEKAAVLEDAAKEESFKGIMEAFARVQNISKKGTGAAVNPELFKNKEEQELYDQYMQVKDDYEANTAAGEYHAAFAALRSLQPFIQSYFNETMVMAEDEVLKNNRLGQMKQLAALIESFANMDAVIVK